MPAVTRNQFPNVERWFARYLTSLMRFSDDDYVVLRHELGNAAEYLANLELLETHLGIAARKCQGFEQLINEKRSLGADLDSANRTILDKLAEIRAVVGLDELGFSDIAFRKSPELIAQKDNRAYAVEITRISASGGIREPPQIAQVRLLTQGDQTDLLWRQIITKVLAKREQLLKAANASHLIWISTGRDYFTAGRYEPEDAGLRRGMPNHLRVMVETACFDSRIRDGYPELEYLAASPGRQARPFIFTVGHDP